MVCLFLQGSVRCSKACIYGFWGSSTIKIRAVWVLNFTHEIYLHRGLCYCLSNGVVLCVDYYKGWGQYPYIHYLGGKSKFLLVQQEPGRQLAIRETCRNGIYNHLRPGPCPPKIKKMHPTITTEVIESKTRPEHRNLVTESPEGLR